MSVQGVERDRSVLVDGSAIGTDPLFQAAGILTRPLPGEHLVRKRQREQQDQVRPTLWRCDNMATSSAPLLPLLVWGCHSIAARVVTGSRTPDALRVVLVSAQRRSSTPTLTLLFYGRRQQSRRQQLAQQPRRPDSVV